MQTSKELLMVAIVQTMSIIGLSDDIRRCDNPSTYRSKTPCTCSACKGNIVIVSGILRQWLTDNDMPS